MGEPGSSFMNLLGIQLVKASGGMSMLEMEVQDRHLQSMGWTHGGVYATLADCGMYCAVAGTKLDHNFVTASMTINMLAPSKLGDVLTCMSETLHKGASTAVARCIIESSGRQVAAAQATFMTVRNRDDSQGLSK